MHWFLPRPDGYRRCAVTCAARLGTAGQQSFRLARSVDTAVAREFGHDEHGGLGAGGGYYPGAVAAFAHPSVNASSGRLVDDEEPLAVASRRVLDGEMSPTEPEAEHSLAAIGQARASEQSAERVISRGRDDRGDFEIVRSGRGATKRRRNLRADAPADDTLAGARRGLLS